MIYDNYLEYSEKFASEYGVTLVLKNSPTLITQGKDIYLNPTGSQNLATVGSGDVLSGIISGVFSQSKNPLNSALVANYIHGLCSDILKNKCYGNSVVAGDLIDLIPNAIYQLLN